MTTVDQASRPARLLRTASGVTVLLLLIVGPLNYGSTRPGGTLVLAAGCALALTLWLLSGALAGDLVLLPTPATLGALLVMLVGTAWFFLLEQASLPRFTAQHFERVVERWPYSVVPRLGPLAILWPLCAVGALFVVHDLAQQTRWRTALLVTIALTAALVAALGLLQNVTHARGIYWDKSQRMPGAFFGPFFHHTSAGAYLNSAWPCALALVALCFRSLSRWRGLLLTLSTLAFLLIVVAHTGHVSRFPQVIAVAVLVAGIVWFRPWRFRLPRRLLLTGVVVLVAAVPVGLFALDGGRVQDIRARWSLLNWSSLTGSGEKVPPTSPEKWPRLMRADLFVPSDHRGYILGDRGAAYEAATRAVLERPLLGWGPGGWLAASASTSLDPFIRTFFLHLQFTHQDYLQILVEWGLVGALGWLVLIPGALLAGIRYLGTRPESDLLGAGALAALACVLTQSLIDFPLQIPAVQFNAAVLAAVAWSTLSYDRAPTDFS